MILKIPIEITNMIYKKYYTNNVLLELNKIHKRYNSHYINWSIIEHIKYVKSLQKFVKNNKRKLCN